MADQAIYAPFRVFDGNGDPVPGAKAAFYLSGTLTLIDVYEDDAATILSTNPVIADANGALPQRFFNGQAKVVITTADDVEIATLDPVAKSLGDGSSASNVSFAPSASLPVDNVQSAVEMVDGKVADLDEALGGYLRFDAAQSLSGPEQTQGRDNLGLGTLATVSPTGTPDGSKFLRDDNEWTTPGQFTWRTPQNLNGLAQADFITIPAGMNEILVDVKGASLDVNGSFALVLGTDAQWETSGYDGLGITLAANYYEWDTAIRLGSTISAANAASGLVILRRMRGLNEWSVEGSLGGTGSYMLIFSGRAVLPDEITRLRFTLATAATFDAGSVAVGYRK